MKKVYSALLVAALFVSSNALAMVQKNKIFVHVQGDSNSEGVLPGPLMEWNDTVCAGKTYPNPWPTVLEEELSKMGKETIVLNHGEGGRRLTGKSSFKNAINGVGIKDGRVSLQQIVMLMMNQGGERNEKNILLINLGANDLDAADVTEEQLYNKLLVHVVTILTSPTLQLNLLARYEQTRQAPIIDFMQRLNVLMSAEISSGATDQNLVELIGHNKDIIQQLFKLIGWKIVIIPPTIVIGAPFWNTLKSAKLSVKWPLIVDQVVSFINSPRIIAAQGAQQFAMPHIEEFGGSLHYDENDHRLFGQSMAKLLLEFLNKQN